MGGNFLGGAVALLYFLMFQLCGVTLAACFLNKERRYTQMILGSAAGSVLLMWLPSLWAFLCSFSITAHVLALISLLLLTVGAVFLKRPKLLPNDFPGKYKAFCRAERTLLCRSVCGCCSCFWCCTASVTKTARSGRANAPTAT